MIKGASSPPAIFLALALSFGIAVLAANPPFQAPDEGDHFLRAFQVSEGTFVAEKNKDGAGGKVPVILVHVLDTNGIAFHSDKKMTAALFGEKARPVFLFWRSLPHFFCSFPHTTVYPPISYIAPALALLIGRLLCIGPLGLMYLARLAGFTASVTLAFAALRCLPIYRWTAMLILLCPMNLYLLGSIAPDGVLISGAFLLVALLLRLEAEEGHPPSRRNQIVILGLAILLAATKPVYLPLAGAAFFLVLVYLRSFQKRVIFTLVAVLCCLVPIWAWDREVLSIYVPGRTDITIDPALQLHGVMHAPLAFLGLVVRTIRAQYFVIYQWLVGVLGWGDTLMPSWFYPAYGWSVLGCLVLESPRAGRIRLGVCLILLGAAAAALILIFLAQYVTWNSPGSRAPIDGIEGRYFLPLAPLLLVSFPAIPGLKAPAWCAAILGSLVAMVSAVVCLWAVISRYYLG